MDNLDHAWAIKLNYINGLAGRYFFFSSLDDFNDRPRTQLFATKKACATAIANGNVDGKPVKVKITIKELK
jgi:hypothetical protein